METSQFIMMRQKDVAEMLCISESWLEQVRLRGGGPEYIKIGRNVRYKRDDVIRWIDMQRRISTSQTSIAC